MNLAVLDDFAEENWPSMDLCAEMLLANSDAQSVRPNYRRRFGWISQNADRALNRFVIYPRHARKIRSQFDCFHICDHSYAHLALELPADRTGVFCHDLDAFRPRKSALLNALARRTLRGLQRAAIVFHATNFVRDQLLQQQLVDPVRLVHAPLGVAAEFSPAEIPREDFILHVGGDLPRKRIDVLGQLIKLTHRKVVRVRGGKSRAQLADLYRRARVLVIPSEAEGFGLPVIEALACGTPVIASDIPALREAGGDAVTYCNVGDVRAFADAIESDRAPTLEARLAQANKFSWNRHAQIIVEVYRARMK